MDVERHTCLYPVDAPGACLCFLRRMPVYWIDLDRFRSGYFIAASVAAPEQDLLPFFEQTLKWDIGPAARQYLASEYNLPRRKQQLRQQAAAESQQSVP